MWLVNSNNAYEYYTAIVAGLFMFMAGFAGGWFAPMSLLLADNFHMTNSEVNALTQVFIVANLVGIFGGGWIIEQYGRRMGLISGGFLYGIGFVCLYFANNATAVFVNRFLAGYSAGSAFTVVNVFVSEIASRTSRGTLTIIAHSFFTMGGPFQYIIVPLVSINTNTIICTTLIFLSILLVFSIPESPYYLVNADRIPEAHQALKFLRNKADVQSELDAIHDAILQEKSNKVSSHYDLIRKSTNRKALMIVMFALVAETATLCQTIPSYTQVIFSRANYDGISVELAGMVYSVVGFTVQLSSMSLTDVYGRKPIFILSVFLQTFPMTLVGLFFVQNSHGGGFFSDFKWIPLVGISACSVLAALGAKTVPYILGGELFPTNVRTQAGCIFNSVQTLTELMTNGFYIFVDDRPEDIDFSLIFFTSAGLCCLGAFLSVFFIPETKGLSLEEIQRMFKQDSGGGIVNDSAP